MMSSRIRALRKIELNGTKRYENKQRNYSITNLYTSKKFKEGGGSAAVYRSYAPAVMSSGSKSSVSIESDCFPSG